MTNKPSPSFLNEVVALLVKHFGADRVQEAIVKITGTAISIPANEPSATSEKVKRPLNPPITASLEKLRHQEGDKYQLLVTFYQQLKEKRVLLETQDIKQFAHLIGLKEIKGKSRKDLLPQLMRFLLEQPINKLRSDCDKAKGISEQLRQQGFSVLTDKLLSGT